MRFARSFLKYRAAASASLFLLSTTAVYAGSSTYEVQDAAVVVHLPMTVGGSFEAETKAMSGQLIHDPAGQAAVAGQLQVDLSTLETGIGLRDRHLRERYLEVEKGDGYSHAVLSELRLEGDALSSLDGKVTLTGKLRVHGIEQPIAGEATLSRQGDAVSVNATFPLHLPDFSIKKPRHLGIGVKDDIKVDVELVLSPAAATGERS